MSDKGNKDNKDNKEKVSNAVLGVMVSLVQDKRLPDLRNATESFLVDEVKGVREVLSWAKKMDAYLSTALKSRMGTNKQAIGDEYVAQLNTVTQERISPDLCREILDPETLARVTTTIEFEALTFARKENKPS